MEHPTLPPVQDFVEARRYLQNVTPKTLIWYNDAFSHFRGCETEVEYKKRIVDLRQQGISPTSINSWLRAINAYLHWAVYPNRKCSPACDHLHLPRLQEEKKLLRTFTSDDVKRLVANKPKSKSQSRIHSLALLLLDTGLRISEALSLQAKDVDLDNFLIRVTMGKGRMERLVPFSLSCRKVLYQLTGRGGYLFPTQARWDTRCTELPTGPAEAL